MYLYTQRWSERAQTWLTEGDECTTIDAAAAQLGTMRSDHPEQPEDEFRFTVYTTPLSQDNEALRIAR